jgi:ComF family protein
MTWPKRLIHAALTILYPAHCCACDAPCDEARELCAICALTLTPIASACRRCGLPLPTDATCLQCLLKRPRFTEARAPLEFGGAIAQALRRLKWGRQPELARPLGRLLVPLARERRPDLIIPVPLHPRRLRQRQFNQAALLARALRPKGVPILFRTLVRHRDTPPQSELGVTARRTNVAGAFALGGPESVRGRRVLLVDDVLTTGATADACTAALLDGGAAEVLVLTVARAVP